MDQVIAQTDPRWVRYCAFAKPYLKFWGLDHESSNWRAFWLWAPFSISCNYTDMTVKENNEALDLKIQKINEKHENLMCMVSDLLRENDGIKEYLSLKFIVLEKENEELKLLVNKSLRQIVELENFHTKALIELKKNFRKDQEHRFEIFEKENQELKQMVYSSLDQINDLKENKSFFIDKIKELENENEQFKTLYGESLFEMQESLSKFGKEFDNLKEHNKSLSSRIFDLESLLEKKDVPNLIDI
jgi:hypothetical protein